MSGYVTCRSCNGTRQKGVPIRNGIGFKYYDCRACGGTGINQRLYSKDCERCSAEIIYPRDASYPPKYCKSCKAQKQAERDAQAAKWKTTRCKICGTDLKYHTDWPRVPDTCKSCIEKEKAKWKTKSCKNCFGEVRYNAEWNKIPDLCKSCIEKEKAKWKDASCKRCHQSFRINTDWSNPPEICKKCNDDVKQKLGAAARNAAEYEYMGKQKGEELFRQYAEPWAKNTFHDINDYCKVKVRSGYDKKSHKVTTDFLIFVKGVKGKHYHYVIDEDGREVFSEWRINK